MFTGIISGIGHLESLQALGPSRQYGLRVVVKTPPDYLRGVALGDSIAINGACMTVTELNVAERRFSFDVSAESLARTTGLGQQDAPVNLEKALRANDRLDGHLVAGHVDGVGHVLRLEPVGESWALEIQAPRSLGKYFAYKGSVAVNGVSLTINQVRDDELGCHIEINLIPHTVEQTCLGLLAPGDGVNLEVDLIARYVERMLSLQQQSVRDQSDRNIQSCQ